MIICGRKFTFERPSGVICCTGIKFLAVSQFCLELFRECILDYWCLIGILLHLALSHFVISVVSISRFARGDVVLITRPDH